VNILKQVEDEEISFWNKEKVLDCFNSLIKISKIIVENEDGSKELKKEEFTTTI